MNKENQIQIEIKDEIADGVYANMAVIGHSTSEFVIDFIRLLHGIPKAQVKSRVIMAPEHGKRLMLALQENIHRYESLFGEIRMPEMHNGYVPKMDEFKGEA